MPVNPERGKIWLPPGTYEGEHLADPRSRFPRYAFPHIGSLASMSRDFAFFSLGIPIRLATFNDAYLHDLASTQDKNFKLFTVPCLRPVFRGLNMGTDETFNRTLFSVRKKYWKETSDFFTSVGLLDRIKGHYYKYMEQEFIIPDPMTGGPEMVRLSVTAVNSTRGQYVARRAPDGVLNTMRLDVDPKFYKFGVAVIAGHPNPMSLIEDPDEYRVPDKPFEAPTHKRMDELKSSDRDHVMKSIEEINRAKQRGEFPKVSW